MPASDVSTYDIQVDGASCATQVLPVGTLLASVEVGALDIPEVRTALGGASPKKTLFVPERLVNFIT